MTSNAASIRLSGLTARHLAPAKLISIRDLKFGQRGWCQLRAVVIDAGDKYRLDPEAEVSLERTARYNILVERDWRGRYFITGDFINHPCGALAYPPADWPTASHRGNRRP